MAQDFWVPSLLCRDPVGPREGKSSPQASGAQADEDGPGTTCAPGAHPHMHLFLKPLRISSRSLLELPPPGQWDWEQNQAFVSKGGKVWDVSTAASSLPCFLVCTSKLFLFLHCGVQALLWLHVAVTALCWVQLLVFSTAPSLLLSQNPQSVCSF